MSPRLAFAIDAAYKAGRSTLALFQTGTQVSTKSDETPVTLADQGAERLIRELIEKNYPGEFGVPLYATLLSYEVEGEVEIGVCYFPGLDEMLYAEKGKGAFFNGRPCHVSTREKIAGGVVCCGGHRSMVKAGYWKPFENIVAKAMATRTWSDAYGHALVATGRVDAMVDPVVAHWDISAVSLIVREAGGRFTDFKGNDALTIEAISSNGKIHQEILDEYNP